MIHHHFPRLARIEGVELFHAVVTLLSSNVLVVYVILLRDLSIGRE